MSNMILVGWVVSEDLSTLGWETVVSKDKSPMSYSLFLELLYNEQAFVMMIRLTKKYFLLNLVLLTSKASSASLRVFHFIFQGVYIICDLI